MFFFVLNKYYITLLHAICKQSKKTAGKICQQSFGFYCSFSISILLTMPGFAFPLVAFMI